MARAQGVVRSWDPAEGLGVIESLETPGGCWVSWAEVDVVDVRAGDKVTFEVERPSGGQDGYTFRAAKVTLALPEPTRRTRAVHDLPSGAGFSSSFSVADDDTRDANA